MRLISAIPALLFTIVPASRCVAAPEADAQPGAPGAALVEVDGVRFSAADLQRKSTGALFQARNALFEAERKAADEVINDYLLDREAKARKLTVDQLLQQEAYKQIQDPSDELLRLYYENVNTTEPYEAVRDKIIDAIRQRRMAKAKTAYIQALRSRSNIAIHLSPPRVDLALENAPVRGASAPVVTLVEYADYECPYCQQIEPTIARLESEFKGKLAFVFKDSPLPMHANSQKAAEAAHCAGAQGKFWEYHDHLFAAKQYDVARLKEYARVLNLNGTSFDQCLDSGVQADRVKQHLAEAQGIGLPGTPSFFVNGRSFAGTPDYLALRQVIEEEIRAASSRVAAAARTEGR